MLAYHSDRAIKDKYIARVRAHRLADNLTQGIGWNDVRRKGCAVGCTLESYDHSRYSVELGVPVELAHLEDQLFELQDEERAQLWPERFLEAIRPGADLGRIWPEWAIWMLEDSKYGVILRARGFPAVESVIHRVARLHRSGGSASQWADAMASMTSAAVRPAAPKVTATSTSWARAWAAVDAAAWTAVETVDAASLAAAAASRVWVGEAKGWVDAACDKLVALLEAA